MQFFCRRLSTKTFHFPLVNICIPHLTWPSTYCAFFVVSSLLTDWLSFRTKQHFEKCKIWASHAEKANKTQITDHFIITLDEDTFTIFKYKHGCLTCHFLMGMNRFRYSDAWPVWAEVTNHVGNKINIYSLSIDKQLKFWIAARPKLGNHASNGKWE